MRALEVVASFEPQGDQPEAIRQLTEGIKRGDPFQTLLGVTGSGKTFTMANVIANLQRPALIISHNKTLAAQLYGEFKGFFPNNAVEYFISYYDYYQPEAYVPTTDTYIEKDTSINEEIDRCACMPPVHCWNAGMWLLWRRYPVFTVWVAEDFESLLIFLETVSAFPATSCLNDWWIFITPGMISIFHAVLSGSTAMSSKLFLPMMRNLFVLNSLAMKLKA